MFTHQDGEASPTLVEEQQKSWEAFMKSKTNKSCPHEDCIKTGLRAIPQRYKKYFCKENNLNISSMDIDECFRKQCPRENRWDYGIKVENTQKIKFVEIHSAITSEVSVIVNNVNLSC